MADLSLQPPVKLTLDEILMQPLARERFNWLVKHGVERDFLAAQLIRIPFVPFKSKKKPAIVEALDPRAIERLPGDLDAMARKIELVNASPLISPMTVLPALSKGSGHIEPFAEWVANETLAQRAVTFKSLPFFLRELARYIRAWLLMHSEAKLCGLLLTQRQAELLSLLVYIERRTGSPNFGRVAGLVNAALTAAKTPGRGNMPDAQISLRRLKSLWKDHYFARLAAEVPKPVPAPQAVMVVEARPAPTPELLQPKK